MMKPTAMLALALATTTPILPAAAQTSSPPQGTQSPAVQGQATPAPQAQPAQPGQAPAAQSPAAQAPAAQVPVQGAQTTHRHRGHHNTSQASEKTLVQHVDDRIAMMHRRLAITAQQEPAWNTVAQVMRDNANTAEQAYRDRAAHMQTMNALDNLRSFAQIEQSRAQGMQNLTNAFEPLYASFSDQQKKTADAIFRREDERMEQRHRGANRPSTAAKTESQK